MTTARQYNAHNRPVPAMASRHFYFVADTIRVQLEAIHGREYDPKRREAALTALRHVANEFAAGFAQSNGQFDKERFLEACGVTSDLMLAGGASAHA